MKKNKMKKNKMKKVSFILLAVVFSVSSMLTVFADVRYYGDIDGDGAITVKDAQLLLNHLNDPQKNPLDELQLSAADIAGTGKPTVFNVLKILEKTLAPDMEFPAGEYVPGYEPGYPGWDTEEDFDDSRTVNSFDELNNAINYFSKNAESGKDYAIFINSKVIDCTSALSLNTDFKAKNASLTIAGAPGKMPILDFYNMGKAGLGDAAGTGIRIKGTNYNFKHLIVQNASNCGMRIKGGNSGYCNIEYCIFRYNGNSGISITEGGSNNTIKYTDSYRNCDMKSISNYRYGQDADGFSIKLSAGSGNKFYQCRSWDNSDDGWDSFDLFEDLTYEECIAWNNGNQKVFSGEYDFYEGRPLDKNLPWIRAILEVNPSFENDYNNAQKNGDSFESILSSTSNVSVELDGGFKFPYTLSRDITIWQGSSNGFKFGSANVIAGDNNLPYRNISKAVAFDHEKRPKDGLNGKGFDRNKSSAYIELEDCIGFNNNRNYNLATMVVKKAENIIGFNRLGGNDDGDIQVIKPSATRQEEIMEEVYAKKAYIIEQVYKDKSPGEVKFSFWE